MSRQLNVVCVKWGSLYDSKYVNRLCHGVLKHSTRTVNFFCVTDDSAGIDEVVTCLPLQDLPFQDALNKAQKKAQKKDGAYKKVAIFEPGFLPVTGPVLALDLDVVITGPIDSLADFAPGQVAMAPPFSRKGRIPTLGEGSVIKFEPDCHGFLYTDIANSTASMVSDTLGSEQTYTSTRAQAHECFQPFPDDWIVSFKRHCRPKGLAKIISAPKKPKTAKVVCFHGRPNIDEAISGYGSGFLKKVRPAQWIADDWR